MNHIEKMEELSKKGFLCEIVTDGWANWRFDENGKHIVQTATPSGMGFGWRGCYWFFDKEGNIHQDDIGCYENEQGGIKSCLEGLFKAYEMYKDKIDPNGFIEKPVDEWINHSTKEI